MHCSKYRPLHVSMTAARHSRVITLDMLLEEDFDRVARDFTQGRLAVNHIYEDQKNCCFCGLHQYSSDCTKNEFRFLEERMAHIGRTGRCHKCTHVHDGDECLAPGRCYFCFHTPEHIQFCRSHHQALCPFVVPSREAMAKQLAKRVKNRRVKRGSQSETLACPCCQGALSMAELRSAAARKVAIECPFCANVLNAP